MHLIYVECILLCITVVLKFSLFYRRLNNLHGDDAGHFIRTVNAYDFSGSLPALDAFLTSYHPPVSFFAVKFTQLLTGANVVASSQTVSFLSLLCAFLLLRGILNKIHILHTLHGMVFLYLTASVPLFVQLATDSTYDSLVLLLGTLTLYMSVELLWNPETFSIQNPASRANAIVLFAILAIGLLTKYSCLLYFSIPFLVLFVRGKKQHIAHGVIALSLLSVLAIGAVSPFYYQRYYAQTGDWMPMAMDWEIPEALTKRREIRDSHKMKFITYLMRLPVTRFAEASPINDSMLHEVWFEMWKPRMPFETGVAKYTPNIYVHAFIPLFLFGMGFFFLRLRKRGNAVSDLGWILTGCAGVFLLSLLYFGYTYPYFNWQPFKAKYVPFAVIWITYLCSLGITASFKKFNAKRFPALSSSAAISLVTAMIILNHTIPA